MTWSRAGAAALLAASVAAGCSCDPAGGGPDAAAVVGDCTDAVGNLQPAGKACRPAAGPCDVEEVCTGTSPDCPADALAPRATICRERGGDCDVAEACSGDSVGCPADQFLPDGALCRAAAGPCDMAEACPGGSPLCPDDKLWPSNVLCRPAAGDCDEGESCTGTSVDCPDDAVKAVGVVCSKATTPCALPGTCDGAHGDCPDGPPQPAGTACERDENPCTLDVCGWGSTAGSCTHPPAADGSPCGAGAVCGTGTCVEGCFIDTSIVSPGAVDSLHACQICDPAQSTAAWTINDEGACVGTGVCHGLTCDSDPENVLWPLPPESPTDYQVDAETVTDRVTGLLWQRGTGPDAVDFAQAQSYCEGLSLGGFTSGWRLPTLIELLSIVDSGVGVAPTVNTAAFPGTPAAKFWSSTKGNQTMAGERWGVDFGSGENFRNGYPTTVLTSWARCVRSEPQAPRPRFTIGAQTVKDEVTGLTWERTPILARVDQAGAEAYCQGLALDGGGWRLPRKKELESIQDRRAKDQAIDTAAFGDVSVWFFRSSTPCALLSGETWGVGFKNGGEAGLEPGELQSVRCVR